MPAIDEKEISALQSFLEKLNLHRILWAVGIFLLCYIVIQTVIRLCERLMKRTNMDNSLRGLTITILKFVLYFITANLVTGVLGIPATSVLAVFGTLGLALSLAMQDTLSNVAGGMLLLYTKPFSSGDFIEAEGVSGTVDRVGLIHTALHTIDNKKIYLPNGKLSKGSIINYSAESARQLELIFPISYHDDTKRAKELIEQAVMENPYVLVEKGVFVRVWALSDHGVQIIFRGWTPAEDFIEARCAVLEQVKYALDDAGVTIPYHQIDVHMKAQ